MTRWRVWGALVWATSLGASHARPAFALEAPEGTVCAETEAVCAETEEPAAGGEVAALLLDVSCLPGIPGPLQEAAGLPFPGTGPADLSIPIADIIHVAIGAGLSSITTTIVSGYFSYLEQEASGKWQKIPAPLVDWLRPHYDIDIDAVRYAEDIDTLHGQGITVDQRVYFPRHVDLSQPRDVWWLMHELQHCEQYRRLGGTGPFVARYAAQAAAKIIETRCFDVHDCLELEQEADAKANTLYGRLSRLLARARR